MGLLFQTALISAGDITNTAIKRTISLKSHIVRSKTSFTVETSGDGVESYSITLPKSSREEAVLASVNIDVNGERVEYSKVPGENKVQVQLPSGESVHTVDIVTCTYLLSLVLYELLPHIFSHSISPLSLSYFSLFVSLIQPSSLYSAGEKYPEGKKQKKKMNLKINKTL